MHAGRCTAWSGGCGKERIRRTRRGNERMLMVGLQAAVSYSARGIVVSPRRRERAARAPATADVEAVAGVAQSQRQDCRSGGALYADTALAGPRT
jgi:uncharacterized membrane protein